MDLRAWDLSEVGSRELLGRIYTRNLSLVLANDNFRKWLKLGLQSENSPDPLQLILFELQSFDHI
jgi:hypothetical protein